MRKWYWLLDWLDANWLILWIYLVGFDSPWKNPLLPLILLGYESIKQILIGYFLVIKILIELLLRLEEKPVLNWRKQVLTAWASCLFTEFTVLRLWIDITLLHLCHLKFRVELLSSATEACYGLLLKLKISLQWQFNFSFGYLRVDISWNMRLIISWVSLLLLKHLSFMLPLGSLLHRFLKLFIYVWTLTEVL